MTMPQENASPVPQTAAAVLDEIAEHGPAKRPRRWGPAWPIHFLQEVRRRRAFMRLYGWAVPTAEAIGRVRDFVGERRALEIGAGNGLWACLLSAWGVSVTATDDYSWAAPPPGVKARLPSGFPVQPGRFSPVERLDAVEAVGKYVDHQALLLCWPPYGRPMAHWALAAFQGDRVVFVGDQGCTADDAFHEELKQHWQMDDVVRIPTWPGIHDAVYLYRRKAEQWRSRGQERQPNPHLSSMS